MEWQELPSFPVKRENTLKDSGRKDDILYESKSGIYIFRMIRASVPR